MDVGKRVAQLQGQAFRTSEAERTAREWLGQVGAFYECQRQEWSFIGFASIKDSDEMCMVQLREQPSLAIEPSAVRGVGASEDLDGHVSAETLVMGSEHVRHP